MVRVAINGFGRIGRNILRSIVEEDHKDVEIVAVNDLGPVETNAHLLRYDSVHGKFPYDVQVDGDRIATHGQSFKVTAVKDPAMLPHKELGVDIVLECTGIFTSREKASAHLTAGARKVIVSAPAEGADYTVVMGVNDSGLNNSHIVISNGSCTTNCLAPMAMVMEELVGIEKGMMTTIHSYTGDQPTLDTMHKDLYRARAAALSQIPTSTGAAKAIGLVLPQLKGKLDGISIRVPTPNVSLVDLKFVSKRTTTPKEVNDALIAASEGKLKGIMTVTHHPLVSSDLNHDPHSATMLLDQTKVMDGNFVNILGWYDNEWGFSNRMVDVTKAFAATL
jgi:glyceraldehyde 3-phosphate dehydrogenase